MSRTARIALAAGGLLGLALLATAASFWRTDCDRPLWTRCWAGCPRYEDVATEHLGAPESRCALPDGQVLRVVLVDEGVFVPHFFDEEGALVAIREEQQDEGPPRYCGGTRRERYVGPRLDCR